MLIIPAIDLQDGCVVRYVQGAKDKKVYSRDPLKTARHWVKGGAQFLHIVDLDGAFSGTPKNIGLAKAIAGEIKIPVEFGGGVRDVAVIEELLESGIERVVLGTMAAQDSFFLKKALKKFKARVIVSIDARQGKVMIRGWKSESHGVLALDLARQLKDIGFKEIIYTDTSKDGTLSGPNIKDTKEILKKSGLKVIASGGISSLDDIVKLRKLESEGLKGIIIGKALYEGRFTLSQAIKTA
jgi:phosphoribosylformimino-5-aminoimidazole carboxamide ribotide isomerase